MWIENPEDENQNNNQGNSLNSPSVGAGGGIAAQPSGTTGNPSTISPVQSNQPEQKFATVQDYLGANQQQGEELGQKFTGKLDESLTNEKNAIGGAASQASNDINAGTTAFDSGLVDTAVKDPSKITGDPDQLNSFIKQWDAAYTGPSSFETSDSYTGAANAANEASQKKAQTETAGGREQILKDDFGVKGQGNVGLDQAILQNSSAFPVVQDKAKEFGTVGDYLTQQSQAVGQQAKDAAATTAATKQNTQGALGTKLTDFQKNLNDRAEAARSSAAELSSKYQKDLSTGDIRALEKDLATAGKTPEEIQTITGYLSDLNKGYGINPNLSSTYNFNPNVQVGPANVATSKDYADASAFQTLTGKDFGGVLNPANGAQAGSTPTPESGFNTGAIQSALKTQLAQQDETLLKSPAPQIGQAVRNMTDPKEMAAFAQKYIDAINRSGQDVGKSPLIKNIFDQAVTEYYKYLSQNRPDVLAGLSSITKTLAPYIHK